LVLVAYLQNQKLTKFIHKCTIYQRLPAVSYYSFSRM